VEDLAHHQDVWCRITWIKLLGSSKLLLCLFVTFFVEVRFAQIAANERVVRVKSRCDLNVTPSLVVSRVPFLAGSAPAPALAVAVELSGPTESLAQRRS